MSTRRQAIQALVVVSSASAIATPQHTHVDHSTSGSVQRTRRHLTQEQFDAVARFSDLIIPRTDTPGAIDAGVPLLIDRQCGLHADTKRLFEELLPIWNQLSQQKYGNDFVLLPEKDQVAQLLAASEQPDTPQGKLFLAMKDLTVDLYYTTVAGLKTELGWNANTVLPEFKGCTHPEHQVPAKETA